MGDVRTEFDEPAKSPLEKVKNLGWQVTMAGVGINLALGVLYSWSVIRKPMQKAVDEGGWGWSSTAGGWPYMIACLVFSLLMVPAGRLQDKMGPRLVATIGGLLIGAGMILAGLWGYYGWPSVVLGIHHWFRHPGWRWYRFRLCRRHAAGSQVVSRRRHWHDRRDRGRRFRAGLGLRVPPGQITVGPDRNRSDDACAGHPLPHHRGRSSTTARASAERLCATRIEPAEGRCRQGRCQSQRDVFHQPVLLALVPVCLWCRRGTDDHQQPRPALQRSSRP